MKIIIDEVETSETDVGYLEIGTRRPGSLCLIPATVELSLTEFLEISRGDYFKTRSELAEDEACFGDGDDLELTILEQRDLEGFLRLAPELVDEMIRTYLWVDFLKTVFGKNQLRRIKWSVLGFVGSSVVGENVSLFANVFSMCSTPQ